MNINFNKNSNTKAKYSVIIPTWNNLDYVKLCVKSIENNSHFVAQIILHINDGSDGTLAWAKHKNLDYTHSVNNVGICWAVNAASNLVSTDYLVYMNDDMYVCPKWDTFFFDDIDNIGHDKFFISATMIEPNYSNNPCVIFSNEFGNDITNFDETKLLENYDKIDKSDWSGATWPPNIVSKKIWDLVGGYSVEFSPGMYSDPDFSMKLWNSGVRYFKGLGQSRVFHFQCKTTHRITKNNGKKQFVKKWGITNSNFGQDYLRSGKPFTGELPEPRNNIFKTLKNRIRFALP